MPFTCAVSSCKAYFKNEIKPTLFSLPKNEQLKKEWAKAVGIKKFKSSHRVCERHFASEDLIQFTEFKDANGEVFAKIPLKFPRLTPNAIPKRGINKEDNTTIQKTAVNIKRENVLRDITDRRTLSHSQDFALSTNKRAETATENENALNAESETYDSDVGCSDISCRCKTKGKRQSKQNKSNNKSNNAFECADGQITNNLISAQSEHNYSDSRFSKECDIINNVDYKSLFKELCDDISKVKLPEAWYSQVRIEKYVSFFECEAQDNNSDGVYNTHVKRSININNNMNVHFTALGKSVQSEHLNLPKKVSDVDEVKELLNKFSKLDFCCGIDDLDSINLVKDNIGYLDCFNKLRHKNCLLFSVGSERCKICHRVSKTIWQKKHRMSKRAAAITKTKASDFHNRTILQTWKRKVKTRNVAIKRC